jgi:hypothetical protein
MVAPDVHHSCVQGADQKLKIVEWKIPAAYEQIDLAVPALHVARIKMLYDSVADRHDSHAANSPTLSHR